MSAMVKIYCPENNWKERTYVIGIIMDEFLGLSYAIEPGSREDRTCLVLENGNELIIRDHFFSIYREDLAYLDVANIPAQVPFVKNQFLEEDDIPVLFGNSEIKVRENAGSLEIDCGIDLLASSFFMLSRWEEYVSPNKDAMGRFPARESTAFRHDFLHRPIVNEYAGLLWNMLEHAGIGQERKERKFSAYLTHDVDFVLRWYSFYTFLRTIAGDLVKRRSIGQFFSNIIDYIKTRFKLKMDPFDTFDHIMSLSEAHGFHSHFFFMSVEPQYQSRHFGLSHPKVTSLIKEIHDRGHKLGFHPDIGTYLDPDRWKREKERLQSVSPQRIISGRQHYLQVQVPNTWQIWEDMEMEWDSSLSYDEIPGFRTGSCYSYQVFNILSRERLSLVERPLTIMDKSLVIHNKGLNVEEMEIIAGKIINRVRRYDGEFVLLWHNNCFNVPEWKNYESLYSNLVKRLEQLVIS